MVPSLTDCYRRLGFWVTKSKDGLQIERQYLADFLIIINNKYFFAHERSIVFHNVRHSSV